MRKPKGESHYITNKAHMFEGDVVFVGEYGQYLGHIYIVRDRHKVYNDVIFIIFPIATNGMWGGGANSSVAGKLKKYFKRIYIGRYYKINMYLDEAQGTCDVCQ